MAIALSDAEKICSGVSRKISEDFPHLTLYYIPHETGQRRHAFEIKRLELKKHPAGEKIIPIIEKLSRQEKSQTKFIGMARGKSRGLLDIFKPEKSIACFFLNVDYFESAEDITIESYNLGWHALNLLENYRKKKTDEYKIVSGVIRPNLTPLSYSRGNMLGDAFASIILEESGKKGSIRKLAKRRALMSVSQVLKYRAEYYPFAIAGDLTQVVYKDFFNYTQAKTRPFEQALQMTAEISETLDDSIIRQWWSFARPAQEMTWMRFDFKRILGAAVYGSEDPHVHTTAYAIADILSAEPVRLTDLQTYNPFADQESFERQHKKACVEILDKVIKKAIKDDNPLAFKEEAIRQNQKLVDGDVISWCSYPLAIAAKAFEKSGEEEARTVFEKACAEVPWNTIKKLNTFIALKRREAETITHRHLGTLVQGDKELKYLAPAFFSPITKKAA